MSRRPVLAGVLLLVLAATGCAEAADVADPPTKAEKARAAFERVAVGRGVVLADVERPAPPRGYDEVEVDMAVRDAVQILDRSVDPALSSMTPDAAVDQVLAKQYDETREGIVEVAREELGGTMWQWTLASRFPTEVTVRSFVMEASAVARVGTGGGETWLEIGVRAHILHRVRSSAGERFVMTRRQIEINTYGQDSGPDDPPWLGFEASVFGHDICRLETSVLLPTDDVADLRADTKALRRSLRGSVESIDGDDGSDVRDFRDRLARCPKA